MIDYKKYEKRIKILSINDLNTKSISLDIDNLFFYWI